MKSTKLAASIKTDRNFETHLSGFIVNDIISKIFHVRKSVSIKVRSN